MTPMAVGFIGSTYRLLLQRHGAHNHGLPSIRVAHWMMPAGSVLTWQTPEGSHVTLDLTLTVQRRPAEGQLASAAGIGNEQRSDGLWSLS